MVKTAVIAAAGQGTRMYPFSLAVPKELIPIGTVPVIQYVLEELMDAGITTVIVVISDGKEAVEKYLNAVRTTSPEVYKSENLRKRMAAFARNLDKTEISYVRQDLTADSYGTGIPMQLVKDRLGRQPFIYTWADDFIQARPSRFRQLMDAYEKYGVSVLSGVRAQSDDDYSKYAYIESRPVSRDILELVRIAEKPGIEKAPSDIGVLSGHLFASEILDYVEAAHALHAGGEFTFNDVVHFAMQNSEKVYVRILDNATYYDCGNPSPYADTVSALA